MDNLRQTYDTTCDMSVRIPLQITNPPVSILLANIETYFWQEASLGAYDLQKTKVKGLIFDMPKRLLEKREKTTQKREYGIRYLFIKSYKT